MASNLLGSACDVLGIKDNRRAERSAHRLTMTGQLGRWLTAGRSCPLWSTEPGAVLSTDGSEPLEVVVDPIDDRDPIEADSLLPRHGAVVVP
jgi:hypothetical protein